MLHDRAHVAGQGRVKQAMQPCSSHHAGHGRAAAIKEARQRRLTEPCAADYLFKEKASGKGSTMRPCGSIGGWRGQGLSVQ